MSLTLNQFILLVLAIAGVVAVTFLVMLFSQLRKTAKEGEQTLAELNKLARNLNLTNSKIQDKLNDAGELIETSKKTAASLSEMAGFISMKMIKPSSKYWPILFPLLKWSWRQIKKSKKQMKEENNGK
jgi:hypothetical protein